MCVDETPVVSGLGPIYYPDQLDEFLDQCDAITVERESLPDDMLRRANVGLSPNYEALACLGARHSESDAGSTRHPNFTLVISFVERSAGERHG